MIEDYFFDINTEDRAYWLGFMYADGNTYMQPNGRKVVSVSQKEADHLASFCTYLQTNYKIGSCTNKNGKTWHRVNIYSEKMFDDLLMQGCVPSKSKILQPPTRIPNNLIRHFLRGYNDGDGGVYLTGGGKYPRLRMRGTLEVMEWAQTNLPYRSNVYAAGPTAQLFSDGFNSGLGNIKYLYQNSSVYMERKLEFARNLWELYE